MLPLASITTNAGTPPKPYHLVIWPEVSIAVSQFSCLLLNTLRTFAASPDCIAMVKTGQSRLMRLMLCSSVLHMGHQSASKVQSHCLIGMLRTPLSQRYGFTITQAGTEFRCFARRHVARLPCVYTHQHGDEQCQRCEVVFPAYALQKLQCNQRCSGCTST